MIVELRDDTCMMLRLQRFYENVLIFSIQNHFLDSVGLKEKGSKGSGTDRRFWFVGVCVILLAEVCHCQGEL